MERFQREFLSINNLFCLRYIEVPDSDDDGVRLEESFSKRNCKFRQRMVPFDWNKSRRFRIVLRLGGGTKFTESYKFVIGTFAEIKTWL